MKCYTAPFVVLAFCGSSLAQSYTTSPHMVYLRAEGSEAFCSDFGAYSSGRFQFVDGSIRGGAKTIKELAYRPDDVDHTAYTGMGRVWNNVTVSLANGDLARFGATFSSNFLSTPTSVFNGSVTWPEMSGVLPSVPMPFTIGFPFSTNYSYSGLQDLVIDVSFSGGKLNNNTAWAGSTLRPYLLDSFGTQYRVFGNHVFIGGYGPGSGCIDGGSSTNNGAYLELQSVANGPNHTTPLFRNTLEFWVYGTDFPKSAAVMVILNFHAYLPGIPFLSTCNKLHFDVTRSILFNPISTNSLGQIPRNSFGISNGLVAYNPSWPGIEFVSQAAWTDTKDGSFKLSNACRSSVQAIPPYQGNAAVPVKVAYDWNPAAQVAKTIRSGESQAIPITRIKY